jgi:prepilin-type N-terminal cleavage/methylation domain-containing protein
MMRHRQGFTLVELLVAMALIFFLMAILSQAFVSATITFRNLKAAGDLANKLRATAQLLQHDLAADHFEGKKRLSDQTFWYNGPPQQGFFHIWHGSAPSTVAGSPCFIEGTDLAGVQTLRSVNHAMAFTIKLRGNQMSDFLSANAPASLMLNDQFGPPEARYQSSAYSYQWAEVAWFLKPSINPGTGQQDTTFTDQANPTAGPLPLYTLYRRQRLAVPEDRLVPDAVRDLPANQLLDLSCYLVPATGKWHFNNPIDLTVPERRFNGGNLANPPTLESQGAPPNLRGADIQLTDVLSFDVRVLPRQSEYITGTPPVDPFVTLFSPPFPQIPYPPPPPSTPTTFRRRGTPPAGSSIPGARSTTVSTVLMVTRSGMCIRPHRTLPTREQPSRRC